MQRRFDVALPPTLVIGFAAPFVPQSTTHYAESQEPAMHKLSLHGDTSVLQGLIAERDLSWRIEGSFWPGSVSWERSR